MENNFQTEPVKRNLPRDVFLHLFSMVTLYWSAISFITLCWQYVNYFFPDALSYNYGFSGAIRFAIASLAIVFPLFMLTSWVLQKIYSKEMTVRESKVRKWLIYLTLFITALVIVGDLIFVINTFLGGEITARFILKALSILVVAVVIFWYYLDDVRRQAPTKTAKYLAWIISAVVAVSIIGAFFMVGSPSTARAQQFDQQRTYDLQNIQYQIVNYWQKKQTLPKTLTDLEDPIAGYTIPTDPETKASYEYTIKNATNLNFQLCATFKLDSTKNSPKGIPAPVTYPGDMSQTWNHAAGRVCFDRTIDKQLYPPFPK